MSVLEKCPSYRESNKGSKERQGPTLGVLFTEVSVKRESTVFWLFVSVFGMYQKALQYVRWGFSVGRCKDLIFCLFWLKSLSLLFIPLELL